MRIAIVSIHRSGLFAWERSSTSACSGTLATRAAARKRMTGRCFRTGKPSTSARRGLELEGSVNHRVLLLDDTWRRLDELTVGQQVKVGAGANVWATQIVTLDWQRADRRIPLLTGAEVSGASINTVPEHRQGKQVVKKRPANRVPSFVDRDLATFLGYLIGDGHISDATRSIRFTTDDEAQADHFAQLVKALFGITPRKNGDLHLWRALFSFGLVQDFLTHLGLKPGFSALREHHSGCNPLLSSKEVVAAFLRSASFDCEGEVPTSKGSSFRSPAKKWASWSSCCFLNLAFCRTGLIRMVAGTSTSPGCSSCRRFRDDIGFGLERKQLALQQFLDERCRAKKEEWTDEIVAIGRRRADVYDISVETTHRYAAAGFINHNSYWHSTIMTQKALSPSEVIDFADHHSGTMAMQRGRLNPYKLGIELFRDVEERWNTGRFGKEYDDCQDLEERRRWDRKLGLGRQKIFEVRRVHNDLTFIDTFLTPEFCVRHNLFSFAYQEQAGQYYSEARDFEKIKQRLLFSLTNFGKPWIVVVDGNYRNRGELLLRHLHSGVDLRLDHAADVLANLHAIWSRPVSLQTVVEDKPTILSFDGTDHSIKTGGENDDTRRAAPARKAAKRALRRRQDLTVAEAGAAPPRWTPTTSTKPALGYGS